jgi:DNA-binding transcriptional MerR regulator
VSRGVDRRSARTAGAGVRIGELALKAGVSTRTLRYYEELGLLAPAGHSSGGARRYSDADAERLRRIKELQELMGLNLDEIRTILAAEDRLQTLRAEFRASGIPSQRREQIVREAIEINASLRQRVSERVANMERFLLELELKSRRYTEVLHGSAAESPATP